MGLLDMVMPKAQASEPVPPFIAPDLSGMTDREILEATYLEIAQARHLLTAVMKSAAGNPMLGGFLPRLD